MTGRHPALEIRGVAKRYGATVALDGVDFDVQGGEAHAIVGENGAGKSTLMHVVAGAVSPDRGEMRRAGARYAPSSPLAARRDGVALIHQELSLCPNLTVAENIALGAEPSRYGWIDRARLRDRAMAVLDRFGRHDVHPDRRVAELSLAARQVVEICRALSADARVLLMDEPTSSFQRADVERLFALVRELTAQGIAVVYISHFLEEVREIADRYTVLRDGRSVATGTIRETTSEELIVHMVGRPLTGLFPVRSPRPAPQTREVLLEVRGISAPPAVHDASFDLARGEILGIAGLVGAGRTELVRALFGLAPVTSGEVRIHGCRASSSARPSRRLADGVGYLSEDRKGEGLALGMSVADNVCITRLAPVTRGAGVIDRRLQRDLTTRWIDALSIRARSPAQAVRSLSGGNQQKVAIGRLLHQDADVVLLDEPTRGIDIASKAQVYDAIVDLAARGKAVLLVSSYLPELFGLCDRLAVMRRGRLSATRPIETWTPHTVLESAVAAAGSR
jgi:ribose transport system ATP-binding protein